MKKLILAQTMFPVLKIFKIVLPIFYITTCWLYGRAFFKDDITARRWKTKFLVFTLFIHFIYLVIRTAELKHPPVTSIFELLCVLGFSLALAYIVIESLTKIKNTGFFAILISSILVSVAGLFSRDIYGFEHDVLKNELLALHVTFALVGYSAFALSAIYGLLYIMLYNKIRSKTFDTVYKNLPNLETIESMLHKSATVGFISLTFVIIVGFIWLPKAFKNFSYTDAKLIGTFVIWFVYGSGLGMRKIASLTGKKTAIMSIIGFLLAFVVMAFANAMSGFHRFY
ncbi:cytochrome C assembly family protein [Candidatus Kryptobacter tengchongensis]|nr:cytochrome c biogenesis protein CcsA [Candidatus Kryptobacter tengchongensis]